MGMAINFKKESSAVNAIQPSNDRPKIQSWVRKLFIFHQIYNPCMK
jgi:hypothetical protein